MLEHNRSYVKARTGDTKETLFLLGKYANDSRIAAAHKIDGTSVYFNKVRYAFRNRQAVYAPSANCMAR